MSDINANVVVSMPSQLFTASRSFKAISNGRIYIGKIDTDPTIPSNQIQAYLENEDGSTVPIPQPIIINSAGHPVYNGQIAKIVTIEGHSMAVLDAYGAQEYYFPNVLKYEPDQLKQQLAGGGGAYLVGHGSTTVGDELDTLMASSVTVSVKEKRFAGGAKGDWNASTQTGNDDTAAFQAAINFLASLPDRRHAGARVLYVPNGIYRIKNLTVPSTFVFAFSMQGCSRDSTVIYARPDNPVDTPVLDLKVEYSYINNLTFFGNLSDSDDPATWSRRLINIALPDGRADCDLQIGNDVVMGFCDTIVTMQGRGIKASGTMVAANTFLNIVCSPSMSWVAGSTINDFKTGMRHYLISSMRTDNIVTLFRVTGSGSAIDYINGITIGDVDSLGLTQLGVFTNATLRGLTISNLTNVQGFGSTPLQGKSINGLSWVGGYVTKAIDQTVIPTDPGQFMRGIVDLTGYIANATINGVTFGPIRNFLFNVGADSFNVNCSNCSFINAWTDNTGATFFTGANCNGLRFTNLSFTGSPTGNIQPWSNTWQLSYNAIYRDISSNWRPFRADVDFTPTATKGGVSISPTVSIGRAHYDGNFCTARYGISLPINQTGGIITISLPIPAIAEFPAITGAVSGGGSIFHLVGSALVAYPKVLSSDNTIVFVKTDGSLLQGTDVPVNLSVEFEVKYKS